MMGAHNPYCHSVGGISRCHVDHNPTWAGEPWSSFLLRVKHAESGWFTQVTHRTHLWLSQLNPTFPFHLSAHLAGARGKGKGGTQDTVCALQLIYIHWPCLLTAHKRPHSKPLATDDISFPNKLIVHGRDRLKLGNIIICIAQYHL